MRGSELSTIHPFAAAPSFDGHRCLCSVYRDRLQSRIAGAPTRDGQRRLTAGLGLEGEGDDTSLTGNPACPARPGGGNLRLTESLIFAVDHGDDLSILRQESAIGYIRELQHLGI